MRISLSNTALHKSGSRFVRVGKQRISYVDPDKVTDPTMIAEFERCSKFGTPRPESQAIRAHAPVVMKAFAKIWNDLFHEGVCDHDIKELCRVYISRSVKCEYGGNQHSELSKNTGMLDTDDTLWERLSKENCWANKK